MSRLAGSYLRQFAFVAAIAVAAGVGIGVRTFGVPDGATRIVLPGTIFDLASAGQLGTLQGAIGTGGDVRQLSAFNMLSRPMLASRGMLPLAGYDARAFRDVLATHVIELRSDDEELTNLELASQAVDGRFVAPFDTFSFNSVVGVRSEARGFRPGLMFSRGEVVTGVGGGVCIVSTAIYNAAVRAGYQVIERYPHSGPVRYAEPGLDAAVVYGCLDMRFKNNTASPLLVRSSIAEGKLTVTLLGRKQKGMSVEIAREGYTEIPFKIFTKEDPTVPEGTVKVDVPARMGHEVTTVRIIRMNGKTIKREVLSKDHVAPRHKIVLVPPAGAEKVETTPQKVEPAEVEPSVSLEKLTEPPTETDPPTWTMPTCPPEPDLDVRLDVK